MVGAPHQLPENVYTSCDLGWSMLRSLCLLRIYVLEIIAIVFLVPELKGKELE